MNLKGGEQSPPFLFITQFRLELILFARQQMTATEPKQKLAVGSYQFAVKNKKTKRPRAL